MNRIYERLKSHPYLKDKLVFNESMQCLSIVFHEYLWLNYFEGSYATVYDEGLINLNGVFKGFTAHWHIQSDDEAVEVITNFVNEDMIYIENANANIFTLAPMKIIRKEKFEKNKEKYMSKKSLRIYTVNKIIKKNDSINQKQPIS